MTAVQNETFGVLTDSAVERARLRDGIPERIPYPPTNFECSRDTVRHFANAYGDDNPLYCDPDYARNTRWGGITAPPTYQYTMGEDAAGRPDAERKALFKGDPFAGLGSYQAQMDFEWWRPITLGDHMRCLRSQVGVEVKSSKFGGRAAHVTRAFIYENGDGQLTGIRRGTWINAERTATKERKTETLAQVPYTAAQLAEIDAAYAAETRTGNHRLTWEDVEVGHELPTKVKGPLTTTDIVVWHLGWGMQLTPNGAFKLSHQIRSKAPGLFPQNALNIPDTVQRLHWEPGRAHELGLPTSYDYGAMRETWLAHLLTDWIGDEGWLWKLTVQHRGFNYIGDTTWIRGTVRAKRQVDGRNEVDIDLYTENQRGQVTSPATATVLLPTREAAVALPEPPAETSRGLLAWEIDEHSRR